MWKFFFIIFIAFPIALSGQFAPIDSTNSEEQQTTTYKKKKSRPFKGPPGKAALYSLIVPGGGQVYNNDYWKVPLVIAGEGLALFYVFENNRIYNNWNNCYTGFLENGDAMNCSVDGISQSDAFRIRNSARSQRELTYVFLGVAHLLNIVEAFVDRHLTLFDISDDLTFAKPVYGESQIQLISFKIPISR